MGYQVSVDVRTHRANLETRGPTAPVLVLIQVLDGEREGWRRRVHEVRCLGPSQTEYGWGAERAHARGARFGASVWIYTESPVAYRDEDGWHVTEGTRAC